MSPSEFNELYGELRSSKYVRLHQYTPRMTLAAPSIDHLRLFTVPRLPAAANWGLSDSTVIQLDLFAGQMWLNSYQQYEGLCCFLGLAHYLAQKDGRMGADGFEGRTVRNPDCDFRESPVAFLQGVMSMIRADSQDISKTDLGRVLRGDVLRPEDFEGRVAWA